MTKIFIDNSWQEYDYSTLYNTKGYTNTPSRELEVYDSSLVLLEGWNNSGFNWIEQDTRWYPENETPYYIDLNRETTVYKIDQPESYPVYFYMGSGVFYIASSEEFTSFTYLHDNEGYTQTPSEVYAIDQGVPVVWYNSDEGLYWDDRVGYKQWTEEPPVLDQDFYGGNFTTLDNILSSSLDGGGSLIQAYHNSIGLIDLIGLEEGHIIPIYYASNIFFDLIGWSDGGRYDSYI